MNTNRLNTLELIKFEFIKSIHGENLATKRNGFIGKHENIF